MDSRVYEILYSLASKRIKMAVPEAKNTSIATDSHPRYDNERTTVYMYLWRATEKRDSECGGEESKLAPRSGTGGEPAGDTRTHPRITTCSFVLPSLLHPSGTLSSLEENKHHSTRLYMYFASILCPKLASMC